MDASDGAAIPRGAEWAPSTIAAAWLTISVQVGFGLGAVMSAVVSLADMVPAGALFALSAIGAAALNAMARLRRSSAPALIAGGRG